MSETSIRGAITEHQAAIILASRGYDVHWPFDPIATYDLLVGKDGVYRKIQVKGAHWQENSLRVGVRAGRGLPYQPGDFDLLMAVADDGRAWLIPYTACHDRQSLSLDTKLGKSTKAKPYDPSLWLLK